MLKLLTAIIVILVVAISCVPSKEDNSPKMIGSTKNELCSLAGYYIRNNEGLSGVKTINRPCSAKEKGTYVLINSSYVIPTLNETVFYSIRVKQTGNDNYSFSNFKAGAYTEE